MIIALSFGCSHHRTKLNLFKVVRSDPLELVCNRPDCCQPLGDDPRLEQASWYEYFLKEAG